MTQAIQKTLRDSAAMRWRFCRHAVDRFAATRYGDVLQLYLHGYPLTYQGPDAGDKRLGLNSFWHHAGFRGFP